MLAQGLLTATRITGHHSCKAHTRGSGNEWGMKARSTQAVAEQSDTELFVYAVGSHAAAE
jgi:hypothetical protein